MIGLEREGLYDGRGYGNGKIGEMELGGGSCVRTYPSILTIGYEVFSVGEVLDSFRWERFWIRWYGRTLYLCRREFADDCGC